VSRRIKSILVRHPRVLKALRAFLDSVGAGAISRRLYARLSGAAAIRGGARGHRSYFHGVTDLPPRAREIYQDIKRAIDAERGVGG
jgi:hypothetical protein